jgi:two-component system, cell cycle sensor histidine kinase and response regulator CckA
VKRVLVVDDYEENLYLLEVLLQTQGYEVESAHNGAEALAKAQAAPPHLIVSDILMPVMDGFALCRAWKADETLKHVPFVFYTATYTDPRDEQLARDLGADAFIKKPAEPDAFLSEIVAVLSRAEGGELASTKAPDAAGENTLTQYSEALVRKLEQKMFQLERANEDLGREIAERRLAEEALRRQLALDELVKDLLAQTMSASAAELDDLISAAVERIAAFMDVDSAIVFQITEDLETWGATYGWAARGIESVAGTLKKVPIGTLQWVETEMMEGRTVCLNSVEDVPPPASDLRALWQKQNLTSALMVPLRGRGFSVKGCLALFAIRNRPRCGPEDIHCGEQLAEAIAGALGRKLMEESLRASDERLRQAQKMEAIGQLAGGIAHDFNNLLTAILGYSDLILADDTVSSSPDWVDALTEIRKATKRAAELTGQILAFSRRQALRPEVVSLNDAINEVRPLLERTLGENVTVEFELDAGLGRCEVDPHQLVSVLVNLAVNARDAMPQGGSLLVRTANVELDEEHCDWRTDCRPGSYVLLSAADTGTGMDEETQSHIFEPFFTTKDPGHGTGLGLSTVHGIVKQSGGHISVDSELGKGTTFRIYLPKSERPPQSPEPPPPVESRGLGGETILVVEDEESLRVLIRRALVGAGYKVLLTSTGVEALELTERDEHVDLVLTDLMLPGDVQGSVVAQRVHDSRPGLPVLYMSGYSAGSIPRARPRGGVVNYLDKPFTIADLTTKVRQVLDTRLS